MRLKFWEKEGVSVIEVPHDEAAIEALERAEKSLQTGKERLEEIKSRRIRLAAMAKENHLAPAIYEAFMRRRDD